MGERTIWGLDIRRTEGQRAETREAVASGAALNVPYLTMNAASALMPVSVCYRTLPL